MKSLRAPGKMALFMIVGLLTGVLLGVFVILNGPSRQSKEGSSPPTVGSPARDFSLTALDGTNGSLSDLRGKVVVINFWATWCPPCKEEMPVLQSLADRYPDRLVVIGVDYAEDEAVVRQFVDAVGVTFPIWLDTNGQVSDLYYVRNYPMTFFVDQAGIIRGQHLGLLSEQNIERYLRTVGITP